MDIIFHYPPELMSLLIDTIPLLCRSKKDILLFSRGAGVGDSFTRDEVAIIEANRDSITKYEIVRNVLTKLNARGERSLRERREVLKRVYEFDDFSTCWPDDQLKAKGLVAEVRRVTDTKDSFTRIEQERQEERKRRQEEQRGKLAEVQARRTEIESIKANLYALFGEQNQRARGKALEGILAQLFKVDGILVREAFARVGTEGEGTLEQVDGVVMIDGHIYLVEMKWRHEPLGVPEVSQHLVRVFSRGQARGILISASGFTGPAITGCKEFLSQGVVVLCRLEELVRALEQEVDLRHFFRSKIEAAIVDKNPLCEPLS